MTYTSYIIQEIKCYAKKINYPLLSLSYRHKTVTFVIQRVLFHAWQDGKRNPSALTPIFHVKCQYVTHLAPMGNADCQMFVHVKWDGELFGAAKVAFNWNEN